MAIGTSIRRKKYFIILIPIIYIVIALFLLLFAKTGFITTLPPPDNQISFDNSSYNQTFRDQVSLKLSLAENFTNNNLVAKDGFVYLSLSTSQSGNVSNETNSEALSYILYWTAVDRNKEEFDRELLFVETYMQNPQAKYLMWNIGSNREAVGSGRNVATDADLRTIKALLVANDYWNNKTYQSEINVLAKSLKNIAVTHSNLFAPYGGIDGSGKIWKTDEVWLSYADFTVFRDLAYTTGEPWRSVYHNMKNAYLDAQLPSGLYQSDLSPNGDYSSLDGNYSINALWMMVRAAESGDPQLQESAQKALLVYKNSFYKNGEIYTSYTSDGQPASTTDSPWTYALVGRTAIALGDENFSEDLVRKLLTFQNTDMNSSYYGSFVEGSEKAPEATQFTQQESIITLQSYLDKIGYRSLDGKRTA